MPLYVYRYNYKEFVCIYVYIDFYIRDATQRQYLFAEYNIHKTCITYIFKMNVCNSRN